MFHVGDTVLYGAQGVCKIEGTEENDLGGNTVEYYVLRPVFDENAKIYVPMNNQMLLSRMRDTLTDQEARRLLDSTSDAELIWNEDDTLRKQQYQAILSRSMETELLSVVKTLYLHQKEQKAKGKNLHISDENIYKQAKGILLCELAFAMGISQEEAERLLMSCLSKQRAKRLECSTTWCNARERHFAWRRRDK